MPRAGEDIPFACTCGKLAGTLLGASPRTGTHVNCYCADCRSAELYKNQPDPVPGPVGLFQTTPDRVHFEHGLEHLAVFSIYPGKLLRWYASCCGAIMFATLRYPKMAFASIRTDRLETTDPLGPVVVRAFFPQRDGTQKHEGAASYLLGTIPRIAVARITGRWKKTPFFDPTTLEPVRPVHELTDDERAALPLARSSARGS